MAPLLARHNENFSRSYARWFAAIYKDKYEYVGDFELMQIAFQLDLGLYYLGVASQPFKSGPKALAEPVFSTRPSVPFFHLMRIYNRRLAAIARSRRHRGVWGRANDNRRLLVPGFTFSPKTAGPILKSLARWAWLELREGWRSWFAPQRKIELPAPTASATAQAAP
jgi:hypothetical protein